METFWTIVVYAFIIGMGALGGLVFMYWLVVIPKKARSGLL